MTPCDTCQSGQHLLRHLTLYPDTLVDATEIDADGITDADSIGKKARIYMRQKYKGVVLPVGATKSAYIRRDGINEYTNPRKFLSNEDYSSKMMAATELENLLQASSYLRWSKDDGHHPEAVRGWTYWRTVFAVKDADSEALKVFQGDVQIMRIARGDVFHDITRIKEITNDTIGQSIVMDAKFVGDEGSIAQPDDSVKFSPRDAAEFTFEYNNNAEPSTARGVARNGSYASPISSASTSIVAESPEDVNKKVTVGTRAYGDDTSAAPTITRVTSESIVAENPEDVKFSPRTPAEFADDDVKFSKLKDITNSPTVQAYLSGGDRTNGDVLDLTIAQPDDSVKFSLRDAAEFADDGDVKFSKRVTDEETLDFLNGQETEADAKYSGRYDYDTLVSKPDMIVTPLDNPGGMGRDDAVKAGMENVRQYADRTSSDGAPMMYIKDLGQYVAVGNRSLRHGLGGRRTFEQIPVIAKAGDILRNAIVVNEADPKYEGREKSWILLSAARAATEELVIVRGVVDKLTSQLTEINSLYAIYGKKKRASRTSAADAQQKLLNDLSGPTEAGRVVTAYERANGSGVPSNLTISIADLLEGVNGLFDDVISEDVAKRSELKEARASSRSACASSSATPTRFPTGSCWRPRCRT